MREEQNYSQQLPLPWIDGGNMPDGQSFFESRCLLIVVGNVFKAEAETPRKKNTPGRKSVQVHEAVTQRQEFI